MYVLFLVVAAAMPYRFSQNIGYFSTLSILDLVLLFGVILTLIKTISKMCFYVGNTRMFLCLLVPILIGEISILWTANFDASMKYLFKLTVGLISYLVIVNLGKPFSEQFLRRLWLVFSVCCLLGSFGFYLGIPGFQYHELREGGNLHLIASAYGRFGNPFIGRAPDFSPIIAFCMFVILAYSIIHKSKLYALLSFVLTLAVILSLTRGVLIGYFVALIFFALSLKLNIREFIKLSATITIVIITLSCVVFTYKFEIDNNEFNLKQIILKDRTNTDSIDSRLEIYKYIVGNISKSPIIGYGVGVFNPGESISDDVIAAHNTYLQFILFYGIPLGIVSIIILFYTFIVCWRWRAANEHVRIMSLAVSSALITILISALSQPFLDSSVPRVLFCLLIGLSMLVLRALKVDKKVHAYG